MSLIVLQHPQLDGARCTVHSDSLSDWEARGWEVVGDGYDPLSTLTVEELAALDDEKATTESVPATGDEAAHTPKKARRPRRPASVTDPGTPDTPEEENPS